MLTFLTNLFVKNIAVVVWILHFAEIVISGIFDICCDDSFNTALKVVNFLLQVINFWE